MKTILSKFQNSFLLAAALTLLASPVVAQDADPLADIRSQLKNPDAPFSMIVEFKVKADMAKEFKALVREAVKNTRKEEGNATYQVHADAKDPNTLVFVEIWRSMKALEDHVKQDYTAKLLGAAATHCEGKPSIRILTPATGIPGPKAPGAPGAPGAPAPGVAEKKVEK